MNPDEDGDFGWFAFGRRGEDTDDIAEDAVTFVTLRADEYAGPFRERWGVLGEDFEDLQRQIGISRELHDAVIAWNDDFIENDGRGDATWERSHFDVQQALLRRLAAEVHEGIEVEEARDEPPVAVSLRDVAAVRALPDVPADLLDLIAAWAGDAFRYDYATGESDADIFRWQDLGDALARRLQRLLGRDYEVTWR